jgi:hypothetical protein
MSAWSRGLVRALAVLILLARPAWAEVLTLPAEQRRLTS